MKYLLVFRRIYKCRSNAIFAVTLRRRYACFRTWTEKRKRPIFERLHRRQYVTGSKLLRKGNPVKRMYFIVRGTLSYDDQPMLISFPVPDQHLDNANQFCGEELFLWHLESSAKADASSNYVDCCSKSV